jgi:microsomal dipeptidase-like Zn-dependent dipeptidase
LLAGENLAAELKRRNYSEVAIGKILGDNLLRILRQVLP